MHTLDMWPYMFVYFRHNMVVSTVKNSNHHVHTTNYVYLCKMIYMLLRLQYTLRSDFSLVLPPYVKVAIGLVVSERYGSFWWLLIDSSLQLLTLLLTTLTSGTSATPHAIACHTQTNNHTHWQG